MGKSYVVVAEVRGGKLRHVTLEAVQAVSSVKDDGDTVSAVLLGHQVASLSDELAQYVSGQVVVVDDAALETYNSETYFAALKEVLGSLQPHAVFFGHTAAGRDLAPMAAAFLKAGQISDVIGVEKSGTGVLYNRPLYAGKVFEKKSFVEGPQVVTVRPNNFAAALPAGSSAEIVKKDFTAPGTLRSVVKDVVRKTSGKVDLTEAKIVVSGGRGVKSADGFKPLEQLAEVLNAAVGASRGACDAGYCDYAMQIGQTGKVVTPEIYIACGISGAIQHLAGMSQSRIIIAVNKDPEAPIFKVADYGIVGDLFEVVPLLTEELKKALA
ncbi:electron transfer flavoprotein subunit alpha/FixB family protein [Cohnella pontilimi]|uniref:Electron transfer flavoprotein subunit alpha/FixB family protein n=1 Tax=Cohnella pontilimi TaxID=2564100 RepID=A0A4U0FDM3_9BACL|nr:electron transfer flavoprotein subunit alpha/FixB family protein [Cohnella pontilimi]TJY42838.1 electron transfer flavoprotein subunit alpha/FixB family protein [Cohnella pontilimi]